MSEMALFSRAWYFQVFPEQADLDYGHISILPFHKGLLINLMTNNSFERMPKCEIQYERKFK